jgi:hypothetical protein
VPAFSAIIDQDKNVHKKMTIILILMSHKLLSWTYCGKNIPVLRAEPTTHVKRTSCNKPAADL